MLMAVQMLVGNTLLLQPLRMMVGEKGLLVFAVGGSGVYLLA